MHEGHTPATGRLIFGVVVIVLGVLFTLDSVGMLDAGQFLRWWPVVPILYGVARLTGFGCRQNTLVGAIFTVAGALFLLHDFDVISLDPWSLFWPLVLLAFGFTMVRGSLRRNRLRMEPGFPVTRVTRAPGEAPADGPAPSRDSTFTTFVMWSGVERKITSQDFRGGDATALMGGAEIDLRPSQLHGGEAVIEVLVLWGGIDLFVPTDWKVSIEAMPLMAGIEDATRAPSGEVRGHLIVKGLVLMGGVEVKN